LSEKYIERKGVLAIVHPLNPSPSRKRAAHTFISLTLEEEGQRTISLSLEGEGQRIISLSLEGEGQGEGENVLREKLTDHAVK
jgi:hypothetical protein